MEPNNPELPIIRCVCENVTFQTMKAAGVTSIEDAATRFKAGTHCGLCRPYIERMTQTGETAFGVDLDPRPRP